MLYAGERVTLSPDGRTLAVTQSTIALRETATGTVMGELAHGHRGLITAAAFSPDGRLLATGGADTSILIWDWTRICGLKAEPGARIEAGKADALWATLAEEDAARACRAIGTLAAAPETALAFLKDRLRPASEKDEEPVRKRLAELDHDQFAVREKAYQDLQELGAEGQPLLQKALAGKLSLEARRRVETLLAAPAMAKWSPETLRKIRAVQLLESVGTPEARLLLEALARGTPEARLTQDAKAALDRLANRPVAAP